MRTHTYCVTIEQDGAVGYYVLAGRRCGPFDSPEASELHLVQTIQRWRARAHALGGYLVRRTWLEVLVVLPEHVEARHADPPTDTVTTRHTPEG